MKTDTLKNTNFILIVIGQIISLFGNGIVRFALPLYLLKITGSSAIFGVVNALSFLPLILVMPIGGIIADRVNKRNIMVILDCLTGILMMLFLLFMGKVGTILLIIVTMMVLYSIHGLYQPAVQSSMPCILDDTILVKGNSIVSSVSSLSNLLSPIIGGFLFAHFNIHSIIMISAICFFISAILELFISIPYNKTLEKQSILEILKIDTMASIHYIFKEKVILSKMVLITCILNAFISALIMIALPILITKKLGFSSEIYGIAAGLLAFGGLFGGVITGILKPKMEQLKLWFSTLTLSLVPLFLAPFFVNMKMVSFSFILCSAFFVMCIATVLSISIMTYIQNNTPENMVGKVMAFLFTLSICSQPIGQLFYGFVFEYGSEYESLIILIPSAISILVGRYIARSVIGKE